MRTQQWYQQLDALQVVISTGQLKKRPIKLSNIMLLFELQVVVSAGRPKKRPIEVSNTVLLLETNPEVFDNEPGELFSDIDRDEDIMFPDHSVPAKSQALAFSTTKTLPTVLPRTSAPVVSSSEDSSNDLNDEGRLSKVLDSESEDYVFRISLLRAATAEQD
ncbi:hypothetical protein F4604DRAFT_1686313 [Suillus subluteus]|nr:hypothetical protein F4604DRAFT_1686313 [Suillus subluteus]